MDAKMEEKLKALKMQRRNRKGQLTRALKALKLECERDKAVIDSDVNKEMLIKVEQAYKNVESVHQSMVDNIESDEQYEEAEIWMEECQAEYMEACHQGRRVIGNVVNAEETQRNINEQSTGEETVNRDSDNRSDSGNNDSAVNDNSPSWPAPSQRVSEMAELKLSFELPKAEVLEFTGNPVNYWAFIINFETNVASKLSNDSSRLQYLLQLCKGRAKTCIESCSLLGPGGYVQALEILKKQFGQPHLVLNALMCNLLKRKQVRAGDNEGLWLLLGEMKKCHITLTQMGYTNYLNSTSNLLKIQRLLPTFMQAKWANKAHMILLNREPGFLDLIQFVEEQAEVSSNMFARNIETEARPKEFKPKENDHSETKRMYHGERVDKKPEGYQCACCKDTGHRLWVCPKFKRLSVDERWNLASKENLCFRCLGNHMAKSCSRVMLCGINECKSDHNRLLHRELRRTGNKMYAKEKNDSVPMEGEGSRNTTKASGKTTLLSQGQSVALRTVTVIVNNGIKSVKINALLDDGSTQTYINSDLCGELGLSGVEEEVVVSLLNGKEERFITKPVKCSVSPLKGSGKYNLDALTTNDVTGRLQPTEWTRVGKDWRHLRDIEFPEISRKRGKIDLLIGVDHPELHMSIEERHGGPGEPVARLTPLGWTCVGRVTKGVRTTSLHANTYKSNIVDGNTDTILRKFWEIENVSLDKDVKYYTAEEEQAVKKVTESMIITEAGRYSVNIPWKSDEKINMPKHNYDMAGKRLQSLENKLVKDNKLRVAYQEVVDKYVEKGYITKVNPIEKIPDQQWFLPHFPVVKLDRETTKIRVVFDASAPCQKVSLNDVICNGPKLQNNLFNVLLRFRKNQIAVVCDISEMYLQIEIAKEDRSMLRFLWRGLVAKRDPDIYEFQRLVFGVNVAPFIAQKIAQGNAEMHQKECPLAAETVLMSTYMDDSMDSVGDEDTAIELYKQLMILWEKARMKTRKWLSNSKRVLEVIPEEYRAKELKLNESELPSIKTLGLTWKAEKDVFVFAGSDGSIGKMTKRNVLSKVATLFDPLGFLSPVTISAKILLQELWACGVSWDEIISQNTAERAENWFIGLLNLKELEIPRCIRPTQGEGQEVHTFVDASNDAYAAVVYLRCENDGKWYD